MIGRLNSSRWLQKLGDPFIQRNLCSSSNSSKSKLYWLNLQGCGLSALERLCLEEALLRHDPLERSWMMVGCHDPTYSTRLKYDSKGNTHSNYNHNNNSECVIVLGIGGKVDQLLHVDQVQQDDILTIRRFSGGGTVLLDHSSLWTTLIGRTTDMTQVEPYPRNIMEYTAHSIFGPTFDHMNASLQQQQPTKKTLVMTSPSCSGIQNVHTHTSNSAATTTGLPQFELIENDYVLNSTHKIGGNAQSIVKNGWLHHTSFLWDYNEETMRKYLKLPNKRPTYRQDRSHDQFLTKLSQFYGPNPNLFIQHLQSSLTMNHQIIPISLQQVMAEVFHSNNDKNNIGTFQQWFDTKCRTKIIDIK